MLPLLALVVFKTGELTIYYRVVTVYATNYLPRQVNYHIAALHKQKGPSTQ